jgi:hypothetical protein
VAVWAEQYRRLWEERYDALDGYLTTYQQQQREQS